MTLASFLLIAAIPPFSSPIYLNDQGRDISPPNRGPFDTPCGWRCRKNQFPCRLIWIECKPYVPKLRKCHGFKCTPWPPFAPPSTSNALDLSEPSLPTAIENTITNPIVNTTNCNDTSHEFSFSLNHETASNLESSHASSPTTNSISLTTQEATKEVEMTTLDLVQSMLPTTLSSVKPLPTALEAFEGSTESSQGRGARTSTHEPSTVKVWTTLDSSTIGVNVDDSISEQPTTLTNVRNIVTTQRKRELLELGDEAAENLAFEQPHFPDVTEEHPAQFENGESGKHSFEEAIAEKLAFEEPLPHFTTSVQLFSTLTTNAQRNEDSEVEALAGEEPHITPPHSHHQRLGFTQSATEIGITSFDESVAEKLAFEEPVPSYLPTLKKSFTVTTEEEDVFDPYDLANVENLAFEEPHFFTMPHQKPTRKASGTETTGGIKQITAKSKVCTMCPIGVPVHDADCLRTGEYCVKSNVSISGIDPYTGCLIGAVSCSCSQGSCSGYHYDIFGVYYPASVVVWLRSNKDVASASLTCNDDAEWEVSPANETFVNWKQTRGPYTSVHELLCTSEHHKE